MASAAQKNKIRLLIKTLDRKYGAFQRVEFMPPPSSAEMDAAMAVAKRNSELIAGAVLGLHGPPADGADAARKLMRHYVDWNEVRVANPEMVERVLGRDKRAAERIKLLHRFLESFFLRQRNLNLEYLVDLKPSERKQFLSNLEVFDREELAAFLLTCFDTPNFPPADPVHHVADCSGLIKNRTVLQMAKEFEKSLELPDMQALYSHLYAMYWEWQYAGTPDGPNKKSKSSKGAAAKSKTTKKR